MTSEPLFWLAIMTFIAVGAFAGWNWLSTRQLQKQGGKKEGSGVAGKNDPMA